MFEAFAESVRGFAYQVSKSFEHGVAAARDEWNVAIELARYDDVETLRLDDLEASYDHGDDGAYVRVEDVADHGGAAPTVAVRLPLEAVEAEAAKRDARERREAARTVETVPRQDVVEAFDKIADDFRNYAEETREDVRDRTGKKYPPDGPVLAGSSEAMDYHDNGEAYGYEQAARRLEQTARSLELGGRDE